VVTYAVVFVYGLWFVLSLISQLRVPAVAKYRRLDVFGVVPIWALFAPDPKSDDNLISYRTRDADGFVSQWRSLEIPRDRAAVDAVFNTRRRTNKVLWLAAQGLISSSPEQPAADSDLSYQLMLGVVSRKAAEPGVVMVQYKIEHVRNYYRDGGDCLQRFVSREHEILAEI
jgi:hypothetical protein